MKNSFKTALIAAALVVPAFATVPAFAEAPAATAQAAEQGGSFVKKSFSIKGDWQVVQENGQTIIRFSDDFKTKSGPDLKVFLSPQSIAAVNGDTAIDGAVLLGVLKNKKGGQDYVVPEGVDLANFGSVLVHCEKYSKLWGGGAL